LKQIILGTAGHIDHGKTTLVKALTGVDTDRLKEEKLRGITIELGFASLDLSADLHVGIVDVPGHEKFVKNMVAGATGIDILVLIISADEGVMPQTREHMEICTLLGIKHGFVALTKIDLVDEEWLELVKDDVADFTNGTFLEGMPIVPVSSTSGEGIPEFIQTLRDLSADIPSHAPSGIFRLPVDRVFTIKGFGTVITGTLITGSVNVGDTITIYPSLITSKVRGLQVHGENVQTAVAGMRTAINFQGLEKASINRGDILSMAGSLKPSYMIDVSFQYLSSNRKPFKNRTRIRLHAGTSEILGILLLLDQDELSPGKEAMAQIRLDTPVVLVNADRFVIRSYSPVRNHRGGYVLNPIPQKHKRHKPDVLKMLDSIVDSSDDEIISHSIDDAGFKGVSFSDLKIMGNVSEKALDNILSGFMSKRIVLCVDRENRIYLHNNSLEKLKKETCAVLTRYHGANPLKNGMPKEELKSKFQFILEPKFFNFMVARMVKENEIISEEELVRLPSHTVSLGLDQAELREKILASYENASLTPPYFKDVIKNLNIDHKVGQDILMVILEQGHIVKVKEDLYFCAKPVDDLRKRLVDFLKQNNEITTPQFKVLAGVSRKYLIPLIEYFDSENVTIRIGDIRKLRRS